ncbi:hypothetical protein [Klebsiella aerogenes]|uniref:hypothetical protein n=1 Tax=Klebsiella aerogenes TaxID=548 RepID=UPI002DB59FDF|nr:hypothetical protein [Klebsiella aerogenes]MEB7619150.1 hypothetical protein [Klebsiella aerogenes]
MVMDVNFKAIGISHFDREEYNRNAIRALGECLVLLISSGKTINKDNILKTIIYEMEKQPDDAHKAYRLALEVVGLHGR